MPGETALQRARKATDLLAGIGFAPIGYAIAGVASGGYMFKMKFAASAAILLGSLLISSTMSYSKPEYVKTTKKACAFCHVDAKAKPKELTEAGKYFKEHNNSLEGYKAQK